MTMAAHPISITASTHEQSAEVLDFPVAHHVSDIERQIPAPEALVASYIEAGFEGNQRVFEKRRVIALLSGMADGNPEALFNAIVQEHETANHPRVEKAQSVGAVTLAVVEL